MRSMVLALAVALAFGTGCTEELSARVAAQQVEIDRMKAEIGALTNELTTLRTTVQALDGDARVRADAEAAQSARRVDAATKFLGEWSVQQTPRGAPPAGCASSGASDLSRKWLVDRTSANNLEVNVLGSTSFKSLEGTQSGDQVHLSSRAEGGASAVYELHRNGAVWMGTMTVSTFTESGPCIYVYTIEASKLD